MKIIADMNIPFVSECFSSIGDVSTVAGREMTAEVVRDADILLVRSVTKVDCDLLKGSKVRFVGTATIGFDHIDNDYLREHKIGFASAPGSNANSVAEYIIAALLKIAQKHGFALEGKSVGIVGVGNVGSKVEQKCAALGVKCYLNDPPLQRQSGDKKYLSLEELFDCDFVTLHTPLTFEGIDKTFHLADEKFFNSLKTGCVFLNTSRGGVVDTGALKKAIKLGRLKSAVLDVWEDEPDIDTDLLEMVDIGTPHIAGYSTDGKIIGMIMIYKAACEYFGVQAKYDVDSFLPAPLVPKLEVESASNDEQQVLLETVSKIYDINSDDAGLRWILDLPQGKRCALFSKLRKEYPVRREFQNTQILISNCSQALVDKLTGIGFKV
ncbi:MAG: 4-phosphoerythronate dehydrogenase PdxB [Planctomycetota bacterium]|jgi:erythronate-4-phosphate dehydrogenase